VTRVTTAVLLLALAALPARADVPPRPGQVEAFLAERVRAAGHACPDNATFVANTATDDAAARERGVSARRIRCANGQLYLVSIPPRRPPLPGAPPQPVPFVIPVR